MACSCYLQPPLQGVFSGKTALGDSDVLICHLAGALGGACPLGLQPGARGPSGGCPLTVICFAVWKYGTRRASGARGGEEVSRRGAVSGLRSEWFCGLSGIPSALLTCPSSPLPFPPAHWALAMLTSFRRAPGSRWPRDLRTCPLLCLEFAVPQQSSTAHSLASFGSQLKCRCLREVFLDSPSQAAPPHHSLPITPFNFLHCTYQCL